MTKKKTTVKATKTKNASANKKVATNSVNTQITDSVTAVAPVLASGGIWQTIKNWFRGI